MIKVIKNDGLPIKLWAEQVEDGAMEQINNLSRLPFAFRHIAIMPDVHQGYGMPIGGVLATDGAIIPNAVGVDIGCGMCSIKTNIQRDELSVGELKQIMGDIRAAIPVGKNHHKTPRAHNLMIIAEKPSPIIAQESQKISYQIGTLGGGNHFIEIQQNEEGFVCVMLHSGSRNLGKKVADHYNKIAIELNEKYYSQVPKQWELAFLTLNSKEGWEYFKDMKFCVDFALENRRAMILKIQSILAEYFPDVRFSQILNVAHNYATIEHHFNHNVMVHRKGATRARSGELGIIPGSQGTPSYIVEGLGNPESFESCSHGAGRLLSRTKAQATLSLEEEIAKLESRGIIHGIRGKGDLDEASGAYKDIETVMNNQKDLVKIVSKLEPLAVVKG